MNKEKLIEMFDDKFVRQDYDGPSLIQGDVYQSDRIKAFIFETILPEILRNIIIEQDFYGLDITMIRLSDIKQKAKELYNIDI